MHQEQQPRPEDSRSRLEGGAGVAVLATIVLVPLGLYLHNLRSRAGLGPASRTPYEYDLTAFRAVKPEQILFRQLAPIPLEEAEIGALAVDLDNRLYTAGTTQLAVRSAPDGAVIERLALPAPVTCLAVGPDATVYLGEENQVVLRKPPARIVGSWRDFGAHSLLTSIAVSESEVAVADAGNRRVLRFDNAGRRLDTAPAAAKAFVIPSPYFDLAYAPDRSLWVVNPGRLRLENFDADGARRRFWGRPGMGVEYFCGCCNPVHMTVRPDGSFVTSEKGLVRVKLYDPDGVFLGVVAGPAAFSNVATALDVACDSQGRVYVLEPEAGCVRVFEQK